MKKFRKIYPFIPIVGIPLTMYYHYKYVDTGLENAYINSITGILQGISLALFLMKIV